MGFTRGSAASIVISARSQPRSVPARITVIAARRTVPLTQITGPNARSEYWAGKLADREKEYPMNSSIHGSWIRPSTTNVAENHHNDRQSRRPTYQRTPIAG